MKQKVMKSYEEIESVVQEFLDTKLNQSPSKLSGLDVDVLNHIKNICISILQTKYEVGYPGGSFVQAIVNNDLIGSFGRADSINRKYIWLYAELLYNYWNENGKSTTRTCGQTEDLDYLEFKPEIKELLPN